jgi:hypothetical protein
MGGMNPEMMKMLPALAPIAMGLLGLGGSGGGGAPSPQMANLQGPGLNLGQAPNPTMPGMLSNAIRQKSPY